MQQEQKTLDLILEQFCDLVVQLGNEPQIGNCIRFDDWDRKELVLKTFYDLTGTDTSPYGVYKLFSNPQTASGKYTSILNRDYALLYSIDAECNLSTFWDNDEEPTPTSNEVRELGLKLKMFIDQNIGNDWKEHFQMDTKKYLNTSIDISHILREVFFWLKATDSHFGHNMPLFNNDFELVMNYILKRAKSIQYNLQAQETARFDLVVELRDRFAEKCKARKCYPKQSYYFLLSRLFFMLTNFDGNVDSIEFITKEEKKLETEIKSFYVNSNIWFTQDK